MASETLDQVTDANVELVVGGLEAFLGGDIERALEFAHRDVVTYRAPPLPDAQTYRGHRGLIQAYADWTAAFVEFEMTIGEILGLRDVVVVEVHQRGRGQSSGAAVEATFWFVYTVEGGKVSSQDIFNSRRQALESVGAEDLLEH